MANKSIVVASADVVPLGGIRPGHHAIPGTRIPPSKVQPLPSRNSPAEPPCSDCVSHGPLSLVKNDERVFGDTLRAQGGEKLADAPVEFLNHVAIETARALAAKFRRGEQRHVRERMREIEEERL